MSTAKKYVVGVDLGGTNMRAGIVDENGSVLCKRDTATRATLDDGDTIIRRMGDLIDDVIKESGVAREAIIAIGLGIPGPLDPTIGGVCDSPNLGQLNGLPIVAKLNERFGIPVNLENDANAAAWGEYWAGAGRGTSDMIMITLGTGIGGGIIMHNTLYYGLDHTAGEIGHVVMDVNGRPCACGSHGCVEAYASVNSTVRRCVEMLDTGTESSLQAKPRESLVCKDIFDAARAGDAVGMKVVDDTAMYLGALCGTLANLFNPHRIVFSGGMSKDWDFLEPRIDKEFEHRAFPVPYKRCELKPAELGGDAGLIGAAGCALTEYGTSL